MNKRYSWMVVILISACLLLAACGQATEATNEEGNRPITVESLSGAEPTRETLTEDAVKRLDLQTAEVQDAQLGGTTHTVIPYASLIYDTEGATWVYLKSDQLTFVRHP